MIGEGLFGRVAFGAPEATLGVEKGGLPSDFTQALPV
jgi:hypothetical protein